MTRTVIVQAQQRWDYCFETRRTETALLNTLNDLGQRGWELVSVQFYKDLKGIMAWGAFLKRPAAGPSEKNGESSVISAKPAVQPAAGEKSAALQGFNLNGNDFNLKTE